MVPTVLPATTVVDSSSPYTPHWELYPRSYITTRLPTTSSSSTSLIVDGNVAKPIWENVPWSDNFVEIDDGSQPAAGRTSFKALYDDNYLYIAALLSPADNVPTIAQYQERNSPIYQIDSDFEVFIDVEQSHHNYKELEVNALGTAWNLWLDKPYRDGGVEHSGRIAVPGEPLYYDVQRQHISTRIISGRLNQSKKGALWSVEMALSWSDLLSNTTVTDIISTPRFLRINFSRVERQGNINWVWQPQVRWCVQEQRYRGFVDMHMPDAWGYLILQEHTTTSSSNDSDHTRNDSSSSFTSTSSSSSRNAYGSTTRDELWPAKLAATTIYYGLHAYFDQYGSYTTDIAVLTIPKAIVHPMKRIAIDITSDHKNFTVTVEMDQVGIVSIRNDRFLKVVVSYYDYPDTNDNLEPSLQNKDVIQ